MPNALDFFNGTNGTALTARAADSGGAWTRVTGYTGVTAALLDGAGKVYMPAGPSAGQDNVFRCADVPSGPSYDFEYTVFVDALVCGVRVDQNPSDTSGYLLFNNTGSKLTLFRYPNTAGAATSLQTSAATLPAAPYTVKGTVRRPATNPTITATINGTSYLNFTDSSSVAAGGMGVSWNGANLGRIDTLRFSEVSVSVVTSNTSVTLVAQGLNGSAWTYQWYRSETPYFTPGVGNIITGATSATLVDSTAVRDHVYWYLCLATETTTSAVTRSFYTPAGLSAGTINILGVGDSNTSAAADPNNPLYHTALRLSSGLNAVVNKVNVGVSGSDSTGGANGWRPGTANYIAAVAALVAGATVFIRLGTNDAKTLVATSKATFKTNISDIATGLLAAGAGKIVLCETMIAVPGAYGEWDAGAPARLRSYADALDELANGTTILRGNQIALSWSGTNPSQIVPDGIHGNANNTTWATLGEQDADAYIKAITAPSPAVVQTGVDNGNGIPGTYAGGGGGSGSGNFSNGYRRP